MTNTRTIAEIRQEKDILEKALVAISLEFIAAMPYDRTGMRGEMRELAKRNNRLVQEYETAKYALRVTPSEPLVMEIV